MCPPLYARFKNGLVYGFIKGNVSTVEELGQEKTAEWIAKKLGKWHHVKLPQDIVKTNNQAVKEQKLWSTMFNWLDQGKSFISIIIHVCIFLTNRLLQVPEKFENPKTQATFETHFNIIKIRAEVILMLTGISVYSSHSIVGIFDK